MDMRKHLQRIIDTVPAEHRERFRRELGEHILETCVRANVFVAPALFGAIGGIIEWGVDSAAASIPDVWGFRMFKHPLEVLAQVPVVEHLPEGLSLAAALWCIAQNNVEFSRRRRLMLREARRFRDGFLAGGPLCPQKGVATS